MYNHIKYGWIWLNFYSCITNHRYQTSLHDKLWNYYETFYELKWCHQIYSMTILIIIMKPFMNVNDVIKFILLSSKWASRSFPMRQHVFKKDAEHLLIFVPEFLISCISQLHYVIMQSKLWKDILWLMLKLALWKSFLFC